MTTTVMTPSHLLALFWRLELVWREQHQLTWSGVVLVGFGLVGFGLGPGLWLGLGLCLGLGLGLRLG